MNEFYVDIIWLQLAENFCQKIISFNETITCRLPQLSYGCIIKDSCCDEKKLAEIEITPLRPSSYRISFDCYIE